MYHVILAGGIGSRFWPKSRKKNPKQLLKLIENKTMIRLTYDRLLKISNPTNILILSNDKLAKIIHKEIPEIPINNFIIEPYGKNTAPAIALAAVHIIKRDANASMGIYPADHLIIGESKFYDLIKKAITMIEKTTSLVTIGIKPNYPATGYGYIQYNKEEEKSINKIYKVKSFSEKPNYELAEKYINTGTSLWNSGIFIWKAKTILNEIKNYRSKLYDSINAIHNSIETKNYTNVLNKEWDLIQSESIDYSILENSKLVYTIKGEFKWSDLGSWFSLFKALNKDKNNNHLDGDIISIKSENNLIISPDKLIAVIGIKDVSIINTNDATLIVSHNNSEEVKNVVDMLNILNKKQYL